MWSGLKDVLIDNKKTYSGMPAFMRPLLSLKERGHIVDLLIGYKDCDCFSALSNGYLSNGNIYVIPYKIKSKFSRLLSMFWLVLESYKLIKKNNYDFIYLHGTLGVLVTLLARIYNVPIGQRLYGIILSDQIESKGKLRSILAHPAGVLSFFLKKNFLLITNDGTKGQNVPGLIGIKTKYEMYYWLNGVDFVDFKQDSSTLANVLFYPARIDRWKGQDRAITFLKKLHKKGHHELRLVFCGHITDDVYFSELMSLARSEGVENSVSYEGLIENEEISTLYNSSLAVLMMYDYSNLGNVFIESFCSGACVVALDNGSLKDYVINKSTGIVGSDMDLLVDDFDAIIRNLSKYQSIRSSAKTASRSIFSTWNQRVAREIELIEKHLC